MLKKILLALTCTCGIFYTTHAQVVTNKSVLEESARQFKLKDEVDYARTLSMARQKGWELTVRGRNNTRGVLIGVDAFGFPKYYMSSSNAIAAATTRANQLWPGGSSGLSLSGNSAFLKNKLGIWDGGKVLESHVELKGRVTQKDNPASFEDHPTHVAGTMIATGINPSAKGMAFAMPGIVAYDYTSDIVEMTAEAPNLLLSNHSYSVISGWNYNSSQSRWEFYGRPNENEDYKFGYYSDDAQSLDSIAYNAPFYLIVKSAGNNRNENGPAVGESYYRYNASNQMAAAGARPAGISSNDSYGSITWDCNAKNILTVGAVQGLPGGYNRAQDVVMSSFSSWGPTDDGRIKPDIVADGVSVLSTVAGSTTSYASLSGTSMAAPNATGSLLLLQEYYGKLKSGSFLRSATLKGLAIHTAEEAGAAPGPDYQYGWGLLNVEKAAAVITAAVPSNNAATSAHLLYENVLNNGGSFSIPVIASGKGELRATICWTDVKGDVEKTNVLNNTTRKLVNDLDIRITRGTRTYMPWILDPANPALVATPGDNIIDNVERIDLDSTIAGQTYTITVSHKGTLARGSQAYSLLVSGVGGTAYCASAPASNTGSRIDSVSFNNIKKQNPAGNTSYTNNTNIVTDVEPSQVIPLAVKVGSSDASNANKIVKVFIDYNNNGVFTDAGELVATSGVLSNGALFTANVTTPARLTVGSVSIMRVVVQETSVASDVTSCGTYNNGETQDYRIRVVPASTDVAVSDIVTPLSGDCENASQYVTIRIKNNGTAAQSNIPVALDVKNGATTVATVFSTYKGTIAALSSADFTFQTSFAAVAGTTYTITGTATVTGDQSPANNSLAASISISQRPAGPTGTADICGTSASLTVTNPLTGGNYFWYSSATATSPLATGTTASTTTIPSNNTYYLAKEASANIGPANKLVYTDGGYNNFRGNYVRFNNSVPVILESVRLYIGNPGTIKITVGNLVSTNADGSFRYTILSSTTLDVAATHPNPTPAPIVTAADGSQTTAEVPGNSAVDPGAVFMLNLPVTQTGDHILLVECDKNGATIFRNKNIAGTTTYPQGVPGLMTITGNSAGTDPSAYSPFYYFFYDMKVTTGACVSDRTAITATTVAAPVITQVGDELVCNTATNVQWYLNDVALAGATSQRYKPTQSGSYKVVIGDPLASCPKISNVIAVVVTALPPEVLAQEIKLSVSPNPNNGLFNLSFEVTNKSDLSIEIYNASGQRVYNRSYPGFSGKFSKPIQLTNISSSFYVMKIHHDKKIYTQKILIQR
ncbi:S8 family serine peptidase [Sediminibacterium ginsengisoli]|uniref:Por secretion system C-terminal sorting domain-containing protein n=1 Tax=Sediminibacterium ginsengisoli TaxID=413434 RepID=A0A1T4N8L2_9BACT|nr:S8 family serine peptidase [Sediminibacterium ginsengisoli]SJZ75562.1 Por secretion system C-terminal sorting domain-containing protein [Sediminibacterium ginsengisoli]